MYLFYCLLVAYYLIGGPTEHWMPISVASKKGPCYGWGLLSNYTAVHNETVSPMR